MNYWERTPGAGLAALLGSTTLFEGVRAGAGTFRLLLDLPARHDLGAVAFAAFSRATDLSARGVAFYALYGFGGALLTGISWFVARRTGADRMLRGLLGCAFVSSILILVLTTQAAPLMWSVGKVRDAATLADLLDRFTFWTTLRIGLADLSFIAVLSALTLLAAGHGSRRRSTDAAAVPPARSR